MIHIWNDYKLAYDLKNNLLSDKKKFIYFLIYIIQLELYYYATALAPRINLFDAIPDYFITISTIFIAYKCYKINSIGDNLDFIERFIILSVPINVKMSVYTFILSVITYFVGVFKFPPLDQGFLEHCFIIFIIIAYCYVRFTEDFRIINDIEEAEEVQ